MLFFEELDIKQIEMLRIVFLKKFAIKTNIKMLKMYQTQF